MVHFKATVKSTVYEAHWRSKTMQIKTVTLKLSLYKKLLKDQLDPKFGKKFFIFRKIFIFCGGYQILHQGATWSLLTMLAPPHRSIAHHQVHWSLTNTKSVRGTITECPNTEYLCTATPKYLITACPNTEYLSTATPKYLITKYPWYFITEVISISQTAVGRSSRPSHQ